MKLTSIGFLLLAAAFVGGAIEHDRIFPSSRRVTTREAVKSPAPLPPVRPDGGAAQFPTVAPTAVAAVEPAAPAEAAPVPPTPPAAPPPRMTLTQQAEFDSWMIKTYLACWKPAAQAPAADIYVAQVRLAFKPDGSLKKPPKLVNPPSDPASKPQAKSALAAVRACNPLAVPAQYRPFYEQWKTKTIHFKPQVAAR